MTKVVYFLIKLRHIFAFVLRRFMYFRYSMMNRLTGSIISSFSG